MYTRPLSVALFIILLVFVACAPEAEVEPTPSFTPTPPPAGQPGNPVRMMLVPHDADAATEYETGLEQAILNMTDVSVDVVFAATSADAIAALCDSTSQEVAVAWLDAVAMNAAIAQNCGEPYIEVYATDSDPDAEIDPSAAVLVLDSRLGTSNVSALADRVFCRIAISDFYTWIVPSILMREAGLTETSPEAVVEYDSATELLDAVSAGECAGASVSAADYSAYIANQDDAANLRVAVETVPLGYRYLVAPLELPIAARRALADRLPDLTGTEIAMVDAEATEPPESDEASPEATAEMTAEAEATEAPDEPADGLSLVAFFGADGMRRIEPARIQTLSDFVENAGLDFTQLGS